MLRTSWKSLLGRKVRLLMSAFAIVLGVAFVAGSLIFTDMLSSAFKGIMSGTVADVNVQAKGQADAGFSGGQIRRELTAAQVDRLRSVPGVASVDGTTGATDAYLIGKDGKVVAQTGAPAIGANWVDAPAFGGQPGLVAKSGRPPTADGEVALDPASLAKSGYQLGDRIRIATSGDKPVVQATIVGTGLYGAKNSTGGATYALFSPGYAQQLFNGGRDVWTGAWVVAKPGVDPDQLAGAVAAALPSNFEAVTGKKLAADAEQSIGQALSFISTFLLVFAGIALVVGSFLIVNTFSILVAQRSQELALLRAMGASRGQIRASVTFEAIVVGMVGATLGLLGGFGLAKLISLSFGSFGLEVGDVGMTLAPRTILVSYLVGIVVTLVAVLLPARRASRVPPVAAMSGDVMTGKADLGRRMVVGVLLSVLGVTAVLLGLFVDIPWRVAWVGLGAVATLLGVAGVSPILGRPVIWLLGRVYGRLFGTVGRLAEQNALRNPRRTAATASALMIGLTVVTATATLGASTKASIAETVRTQLRADYVAQNVTLAPFSTVIGDRMEKVPGVAAVHRMRFLPTKIDGRDVFAGAMRPSAFDRIVAQRLESGSLATFTGDAVLLTKDFAEGNGLTAGRSVTMTLNGTDVRMRVAGVFSVDRGASIGEVVTTLDALAKAGVPAADAMLAVDRAADADPAAVRAGLDAVVTDLPMVTVSDQEEYAQQQTASFDQLLALVYALLGLAIVIAILGIVNTLALSVIERTREIGLLRAIGLERGQLRRMVRLESVIIAVLGAALGVGMGLLFGVALQRAAASEGLSRMDIPVTQVVAFLVLAVVVGVLAATWPAFRASRLNVLRAISTE